MAHVTDYTFNNMGRMGNDHCVISQSDIQNTGSGFW